ncbi:hypothetical protein CVT24_002690 [Panaeolus cyanescens]|uniref:Chromo domain-containing protein n=1 Tax=Panaeolus cyanescens TaxID=181874 RepID=A0A409WBE1_9AGAR|nr:hypothetical protein CVT24_002690 [Panaeolus cyanescens]
MPKNEESQISSPSQKFEPQEGDEEALWEVIEITAEKPGYYKVRWDGVDPKTMKPWPLSWVPRRDCTDDLVIAWKKKQKAKKGRKSVKKRDSVASKKSTTRESTGSTATKPKVSTAKSRSLRSTSAATATNTKGPGSASGSIQAVPEEEEESESETEATVMKPPETISKTKPTNNKRKHAEVSSTHTSANVAAVNVDGGEKEEIVQRKVGPPTKKRKVALSSPLKAEIISPVAVPRTSDKKQASPLTHRPGGRMQAAPFRHRVSAMGGEVEDEDEDEDEERSVEHALSSPDARSDDENVAPSPVNGKSHAKQNSKPQSSSNERNQPRLNKASSSRTVDEDQAIAKKPASLSRKNSSKSTIPDGRKRTSTKKQPSVVASDSEQEEPRPQEPLFLPESTKEPTTPVEERSIFWDGEEGRVIGPNISPKAKRRLVIFDRELRQAEQENQEMRSNATKTRPPEVKSTKFYQNDSQDVVPETEFSSQSMKMHISPDVTPVNSPPHTPPPTKGSVTLKSKMQGRTPLSKHSSFNNGNAAGPSKKALRPIPMLEAEVFHAFIRNSIPETIEEDSFSSPPKVHKRVVDDDEEPPLSSIEQFDTPEKTKSKLRPIVQLERIPAKDKGKKPLRSKEPSASEIWDSEVVQRGQQIAAAAKRKEKEQELALHGDSETAGGASSKRRNILDIARARSKLQPLDHPPASPKVRARVIAEEPVQMDDVSTLPVAPSSHPLPPTAPEPDHQSALDDTMDQFIDFGEDEGPAGTIDPKLLRQEEEESTQDVLAHANGYASGVLQGKQVEERQPSESNPQSPAPVSNGAHLSPPPPSPPRQELSQIPEESQLQYSSHVDAPLSQPPSPSPSPQQHSHSVDKPAEFSIPQEQDDYIPLSQQHTQDDHYGMSESMAHNMEIDEAGPSGLGASIATQMSQDIGDMHLRWATERADWEQKQLTQRAEIEALQLNLKAAEKDREFFREQYTRASAFVSETIDENRELKKRAEIAEGQVKDGVKFVRDMYEARTQMLEDDIKHWRNTAQFMIEKDRMTNDDIRRRAAEEPELRKKLEEERESVFMRDKRIYDLESEARNRDMKIRELEQGKAALEQELAQWKNRVELMSRELDEEKHKLKMIAKEGQEDVDDDEHEFVYPCAWRADGTNETCQATFTTLSELNNHINSTHLPPSI